MNNTGLCFLWFLVDSPGQVLPEPKLACHCCYLLNSCKETGKPTYLKGEHWMSFCLWPSPHGELDNILLDMYSSHRLTVKAIIKIHKFCSK